jgi:hypothetical protein
MGQPSVFLSVSRENACLTAKEMDFESQILGNNSSMSILSTQAK